VQSSTLSLATKKAARAVGRLRHGRGRGATRGGRLRRRGVRSRSRDGSRKCSSKRRARARRRPFSAPAHDGGARNFGARDLASSRFGAEALPVGQARSLSSRGRDSTGSDWRELYCNAAGGESVPEKRRTFIDVALRLAMTWRARERLRVIPGSLFAFVPPDRFVRDGVEVPYPAMAQATRREGGRHSGDSGRPAQHRAPPRSVALLRRYRPERQVQEPIAVSRENGGTTVQDRQEHDVATARASPREHGRDATRARARRSTGTPRRRRARPTERRALARRPVASGRSGRYEAREAKIRSTY